MLVLIGALAAVVWALPPSLPAAAVELPQLTVNDPRASDMWPCTFRVQLSKAVMTRPTVEYTTTGGPSHTPSSGVVKFRPKQTAVDVTLDNGFAADGDITMVLANPTDATILDGTGVCRYFPSS